MNSAINKFFGFGSFLNPKYLFVLCFSIGSNPAVGAEAPSDSQEIPSCSQELAPPKSTSESRRSLQLHLSKGKLSIVEPPNLIDRGLLNFPEEFDFTPLTVVRWASISRENSLQLFQGISYNGQTESLEVTERPYSRDPNATQSLLSQYMSPAGIKIDPFEQKDELQAPQFLNEVASFRRVEFTYNYAHQLVAASEFEANTELDTNLAKPPLWETTKIQVLRNSKHLQGIALEDKKRNRFFAKTGTLLHQNIKDKRDFEESKNPVPLNDSLIQAGRAVSHAPRAVQLAKEREEASEIRFFEYLDVSTLPESTFQYVFFGTTGADAIDQLKAKLYYEYLVVQFVYLGQEPQGHYKFEIRKYENQPSWKLGKRAKPSSKIHVSFTIGKEGEPELISGSETLASVFPNDLNYNFQNRSSHSDFLGRNFNWTAFLIKNLIRGVIASPKGVLDFRSFEIEIQSSGLIPTELPQPRPKVFWPFPKTEIPK